MLSTRKIIGWAMLAVAFAALFASIAATRGLDTAAIAFGVALVGTAWIVTAVKLISMGDKWLEHEGD